MDTVLDLLDELEEFVSKCPKQPFTGKAIVDKDIFFDIVGEIKHQLPKELTQSKWVVEERNKILLDAQKEAEDVIKKTEEEVQEMVNDHEITRMAYAQAQKILEKAKASAKAKRLEAMQYSYDVLDIAEEKVKELQMNFNQEHEKIDGYYREVLDIIFENKQMIKRPLEKNVPNYAPEGEEE